jgi:hypothetical protein
VQENGGSIGNGEANQSQHDMSSLKKIDNENFREAIVLLYFFRGCSILDNGSIIDFILLFYTISWSCSKGLAQLQFQHILILNSS